ncbi:ferritin-like domain-containing protein [Streptomyces radicis]|uniref:VioB-polyketide synthase n=1 Tax=Streptomyces radicis TaxID=1750517 RepID=A0A3A9W6B7_9ACTN|nr:ferritin-like domain-containing protein [Streptomyces radicis]RKN08410.1 VioB - polyketide synthase [Streptomyces radicis]RKN21555.1 VioB - polyketide synthase [Streptomyces radicis]
MSVFDLPRLHFAGTAVTRLPTGPRSGLYDLAGNSALTGEGRPFPPEGPASEYHAHLDALGTRFDPDGTTTPEGRFSTVKGWNFGGNGHFWVDARITGWERSPGRAGADDPVVGRHVDLWGHYNDYLGTTFNRARVLDIDPASSWTTTVMVGQLGFGRRGRSHDTGYMATGPVTGLQPPRWQGSRHVLDAGDHPLAAHFRRSVVHQFVVAADPEEGAGEGQGAGLLWLAEAEASGAARLLRERVGDAVFGGLVVRFALTDMAAPRANDTPDFWRVRGTIAPWRRGEARTCPAGRLLTARRVPGSPLGNAAVEVTAEHATFDLITAVPAVSRAAEPGPGPLHRTGPRLDVGDLELRTRDSGRLVARVPAAAYLGDTDATGGLVTVPTLPTALMGSGERASPAEPLVLLGTAGGREPTVLLTEEETVVRIDDSALFLEEPDPVAGGDGTAEVAVQVHRLGRPAAVSGLRVLQFFNPRALPGDARATAPDARCGDIRVVDVRAAGGRWEAGCALSTGPDGRATLAVRRARAGTTRLLFLPEGEEPPCDLDAPGSAARAYDNDDALGYWPAMATVDVRALHDSAHLDAIPRDQVTLDVLYREVFAPYELLYSFMKDEIFSLADRSRVATHARLIWLMCDPAHRDRTFYMPPTRDMTGPQARLLLAYLRADEAGRRPPPLLVPRRARDGRITTRAQLYAGLREAARLELAVMLQYLYAAWSIPLLGAGRELVRRGAWTDEQLRVACGDGGETLSNGMRGSLLNVAREEMMHFLVINNIITAMGQPFHLPAIDFGTVNGELRVPLDLSLEGFGLGSVQRFIAIEQPHGATPELADDAKGHAHGAGPYPYQSLSDLYDAIREGIRTVPDLFLVDRGRGGGEHHLFMRESVNTAHPDYQLEVDDVSSALFAIDFVTEHGEGGVLTAVEHDEESHYETFLRISDLLMAESRAAARKEPGRRRPPWTPAYPVLRNPSLHGGNPAREQVTDPAARAAMVVFNRSYFLMNQLMIQHFGFAADGSLRRSQLMNAAIDVMTGMMRPLAEHLVTLPSGRPGRTAGPSFELEEEPGFLARPDVAMRSIVLRFTHLAAMAAELPGVPERVPELMRFYADYFKGFDPRGG